MKPLSFEVAEPIKDSPDPLEKPKVTLPDAIPAPENNEDIEAYRERAQVFIDRYSKTGFFASFSGDTSIRFKLGQAFYFDFQKGEVNLATDWFYNKGFSEKQILWACMHEIGHFDDFKNDPERLMQNFDHIADEARKTGDIMLHKWETVLDQSDPKQKAFLDHLKKTSPVNPERPEMGSFNCLAQSAYGIHHPFYNSLDDIWVNNSVSRKAASFERGTEGGKEIESLYKEKLFPGFDYSKGESRHRQFINKLLRDDNVPDEQCVVLPDVEEALNRKIQFGGKSYTAKELIATFIKPRTGRDTKAGERYAILRRTLEPIFKELLAKDITDWKPEWKPPEEQPKSGQGDGESSPENESQEQQGQENKKQDSKDTGKPQESKDAVDQGEKEKPQKSQESKEQEGDASEDELPPATPFEKEIKEWQENTIDQLPPEDMKDLFKKFEEVKEMKEAEKKKVEQAKEEEGKKLKAEDKRTPQEKAADTQKKEDEQWAKKNASGGLSKEQLLENLARFRQVQADIAPYLDELSALWRHIIFGTSREIVRGMEGHFKTGDELDVQKTIEDWGSIQEGKFEQAKIFRKIEDKEVVTQKPELIRVRVVGDMSGSMNPENDGGAKLRTLQQAMTLIFSSLDEFQTYLNATRAETKSKLEIETEGWTFGDSAEKIKSSDDKANIEMVSVFQHIQNPRSGSTFDNVALSAISDSITPDDGEKIKSGKIMDIVLEITDGGSSDPDSAKRAVDNLIEKKIITRAFQIGQVSTREQHTFDAVWNRGRDKNRGERVGVNISALIPAITKALKEYLGDVSI